MGKASNLLMQINMMRDESINLTVVYSTHEVCMRGIRVTSLIGQSFQVETLILLSSVNLDLKNIF